MQQGYTGPEVCKITGISYRQLDHWTTTKLIEASIRNIKGSGFHRIYSFQDIVKVKLVNKLREAGVSLQKIRIALSNVNEILGKNMKIFSNRETLSFKPRQEYQKRYYLNGSLYLSTKESILKNKSLVTTDTIGYIMPEEYSIDIDTPFDWMIAEFLMGSLS